MMKYPVIKVKNLKNPSCVEEMFTSRFVDIVGVAEVLADSVCVEAYVGEMSVESDRNWITDLIKSELVYYGETEARIEIEPGDNK